MAVVVVAALLLAAAPAPARSAVSAPPVARDPAVITTWDTIAVRTIIVEGQKPPPVAQLYLGFVSAAVYNAVVTIDGRFAPYTTQPRPHGPASPEAAAAARGLPGAQPLLPGLGRPTVRRLSGIVG
jgi:hypothetical protein